MSNRLLIVAPDEDFRDALEPLVEHKNATGVPCTIVTLDEIYQAYPDKDEPDKIKRRIEASYRDLDVRYVMLAGDEDKFPVRYVKWWSESVPAFHTLYFASDLYYGTLFRQDGSFDDWDGNGNGYFGELPDPDSMELVNLDKVNPIPSVAVGRVPASNVNELAVYVEKVKRYELEAYAAPWAKVALFVAAADGFTNGCVELEKNVAPYLQDFTVHKLYQIDTLSVRASFKNVKEPPIRLPADLPAASNSLWDALRAMNPWSCPITERPSAAAINAYINQGTRFVCYSGHGGRGGWNIHCGYGFGDIDRLDNEDRLPVVFSTGCDTGAFTTIPPAGNYTDINGIPHDGTENGKVWSSTPPQPACLQTKEDVESMAEKMTVMKNAVTNKNTGAVAYIGSDITAHYDDLMLRFLQSIPDGHETLGEMLLAAHVAYYAQHPLPGPNDKAASWGKDSEGKDNGKIGYFVEPWRFCLFGDPSLRVRGIPT